MGFRMCDMKYPIPALICHIYRNPSPIASQLPTALCYVLVLWIMDKDSPFTRQPQPAVCRSVLRYLSIEKNYQGDIITRKKDESLGNA